MIDASIVLHFLLVKIKEIKEIKLISSPIQALNQDEEEIIIIVLKIIIRKKLI